MYKILESKELTTNIYYMVVEAPRVAKNCQPGQFVIVRMDKDGERIPLTICDYDRDNGTVTIVFQTVGAETTRMAELKTGDAFHDFVIVGLKLGMVIGFSKSGCRLESSTTSPEGFTIHIEASRYVPIASICLHTDSKVISLLYRSAA